MSVQHLTIDDTRAWFQASDRQVFIGDVLDLATSATTRVRFARYGKGRASRSIRGQCSDRPGRRSHLSREGYESRVPRRGGWNGGRVRVLFTTTSVTTASPPGNGPILFSTFGSGGLTRRVLPSR